MIKIIAMLTMLIDHMGVLLFPEIRLLRTIGRIAFPIFAYQLAIGYYKTSNKLNYAKRLLIFGLISQIPYSFLNKDMNFEPYHFNVILLFLYAITILYFFDSMKKYIKTFISTKKAVDLLLGVVFLALVVVGTVLPEYFEITFENFGFSYSYYGILMILIFYIFKERWIMIVLSYLVLSFIHPYVYGVMITSKYSLQMYGMEYSFLEMFKRFDVVWKYISEYKNGLRQMEGFFFQGRSIMAIPIIMVFEKYPLSIRLNKYIAYMFYPVHIAILLLIRIIIGHPF